MPKKSATGYRRRVFLTGERIKAKSNRIGSRGQWCDAQVVQVRKDQIQIFWLTFNEKQWIPARQWRTMLKYPHEVNILDEKEGELGDTKYDEYAYQHLAGGIEGLAGNTSMDDLF